jgi:hypothetical protein
MSDLCEPLPFPLLGNIYEETLFASLGRALNKWEYVEFGLSLAYCLFAGDASFKKMQEYGRGNIFRERLSILERAADAWFVRNCHQEIEGEFQQIVSTARWMADRRNEIAHGLVMDVQSFTYFRVNLILASPNNTQFLLIPPFYHVRKHDSVTGMPSFAFSNIELDMLFDRFLEFELVIDQFKRRYWPDLWPGVQL